MTKTQIKMSWETEKLPEWTGEIETFDVMLDNGKKAQAEASYRGFDIVNNEIVYLEKPVFNFWLLLEGTNAKVIGWKRQEKIG